MKPCNFPARKLARKIAADIGGGWTARSVIDFPDNQAIEKFNLSLDTARSIRTKKRR